MARKSSLAGKIVLSCLLPAVLAAVPGFLGIYGVLAEKIGFGAVISAVLLVTAGISVLSCLLTVYRPVKKLAEFLREAGEKEGDLTRRMPISTHDELSLIARNHNVFIAQIHRIVFKLKNIVSRSNSMGRELASSAVEMSASIEEISSTTKSLATREQTLNDYIHNSRGDIQEIRQSIEKIVNQIDTQAANVNQSSAAVEQTVSSIRSMNRLSEAKSELAGHLNALAGEGEKDMRQTLDSMQEIASSVDIVQDLIKVINSVASKTNLLAMNAAIEAAHAGNHGKGFSVVADEIRKLAETTSRNAKEISESLSQMVKGIETSRQLTEKTDGSIKQMINGIKDVADSLQEIRSGLNEMAAGTGQITNALSDLVTITENIKSDSKNIGTKAEQIDAAMGQVTDISEETTHSMEEFYIGINEIQKATHFISQVGSENAENIAIVDQEVSRFTIIDTSHLKSSDGQPLIQWNHIRKAVPDRPAAPEKLPETDPGHWYDLEFVGWNVEKTNIPSSPADGTKGKKVILLESCDHPYHTAYKKGCSQVAEAFGIRFSSYNADYSPDKQEQQVAMAIRDKPDLIILTPTSVERSTQWFRQINKAGIPVVGSNTTPSPEGFKYILAWTGPDDWGQFRLLATEFAKEMGKEGGYAIIRHAKGNSNYYSRTFSILTELKKIAPNMECLTMESAIEEEETYRLTARWLKEYGSRLKGIAFSDPAFGSKGLCRAVKEAGRDDIVVVSSGNSCVTQDLVKSGEVKAITYQSAEADGALAMEIAVDWFNGMEIPPIRYLPMGLITSENVGDYYPSQW